MIKRWPCHIMATRRHLAKYHGDTPPLGQIRNQGVKQAQGWSRIQFQEAAGGGDTTLWLWLLILLPFLAILFLFSFILLGAGSGASCTGAVAWLVCGLALLADIVWLVTYGFRSNAQVTGAIAVAGLLAGGFAWAFKSIQESLFQRAQVLIREYLSVEQLERSEIRAKIYDDSVLFRLNKSVYIDALSALQKNGEIKVVDGKYMMADATPTGESGSTWPG